MERTVTAWAARKAGRAASGERRTASGQGTRAAPAARASQSSSREASKVVEKPCSLSLSDRKSVV